MPSRLHDFVEAYRYGRKPGLFGQLAGWGRIDRDNPPVGDCEDYATTCYALCPEGIEGKLKRLWLLISFRAVFWLVWSPVNGWLPRHTVLRLRGDDGLVRWYDSRFAREWHVGHPGPNKLAFPWPWPIVLLFFLMRPIYRALGGAKPEPRK
jgi:hypothetical protein